MITDEEIDAFFEHSGVKGMKWGQRKQQASDAAKAVGRGTVVTGKVAWKGTKAVGRGTKKAVLWSKDHPKTAAAIVVGSTFVALRLKGKLNKRKMSDLPKKPSFGGIMSELNRHGITTSDVRPVFEARDASGKVVSKMGSAVTAETIRNLNRGPG